MKTPIYDFVKKYAEADKVRFHMPGHKGKSFLGCEALDITEIQGADVLYSAEGIIEESENNASALFKTAHSFYSAEGSTLAIKAMLSLAASSAKGERPSVIAARNVHKAFIYAAALLDLDVSWVYPKENSHICACPISAKDIEDAILGATSSPCAVYLTSPDYLGNIADVRGISQVCHKHGIPLLVDNAHGAYLAFLDASLHPIALGADMCCDSAHKTLPVLTGGAYLHVSKNADPRFAENARNSLSIFASTSPSYLIMQSLDLCNRYLADGYPHKLKTLISELEGIKKQISALGFTVENTEPLKIVIREGESLGEHLRGDNIEVEFCDVDFTVIMVTPENNKDDLARLIDSLSAYRHKAKSEVSRIPAIPRCKQVLTIRKALFAEQETLPPQNCVGRICASPTVSCPPAVPIAVSGEIISADAADLFLRYGIKNISVIK